MKDYDRLFGRRRDSYPAAVKIDYMPMNPSSVAETTHNTITPLAESKLDTCKEILDRDVLEFDQLFCADKALLTFDESAWNSIIRELSEGDV